MQTVIIAGVTKPDRFLNKGVAYYFRFTLPDEHAIRLKRKFSIIRSSIISRKTFPQSNG